MKLTREQFIAQFDKRISVDSIQDMLRPYESPLPTYEGVEVFRALNLVIIKVDGKYYSH